MRVLGFRVQDPREDPKSSSLKFPFRKIQQPEEVSESQQLHYEPVKYPLVARVPN